VEGVGGARAGVEIGRPADWVEEAVDDFMRKAAESFPGAVEVSPGQSVWRPRPGSGTDPTLTQCADPAERQRLWGKHGVERVRTPPPTPPVPTISEEELPAWLVSHGYGRLEESYVCRASKLDGEQCSNRRRPGSYFCGVHWPKGASR
jgi:hypothetical protein